MKTCKDCLHFLTTKEDTIFNMATFCRRFPPIYIQWADGNGNLLHTVSYPPIMTDTQVCGEFDEVIDESD